MIQLNFQCSKRKIIKIIKQIKSIGVLWHGEVPIDGSVEAVGRIKA